MTEIIKRDGSRQSFDKARIVKAVASAMNDAHLRDDEFVAEIAQGVEHAFEEMSTVDIYDLQAKVENVLMRSRYKDAARCYIEFRRTRDIEREIP